MTDMTEKRIEMLQGHQEAKALIEKMKGMVGLITMGGPEAIREVAEHDPQLILTALETCVRIIDRQQTSCDQLLEYWLNSMDNFDGLVDIIQKHTE